MQYRSGNNAHEPTNPNTNSRCWLFIIRNGIYDSSPHAWHPHINFAAWISTKRPGDYYYTIRGVFQTVTPRNYYTLKSRYSHDAEWIPIQLSDYRRISEFTDRLNTPRYSKAFMFGVQVQSGVPNPVKTTPLHKIGFNIPDYPDLIHEYNMLVDARRMEGMEVEPDAPLDAEDDLVNIPGSMYYAPSRTVYDMINNPDDDD